MQIVINKDIAAKVLSIVDQGLSNGLGNQKPGEMCVEAAVCYALGLPHGDDPQCVASMLRSLKIRLNDRNWSSNEARAKGLRRLALIQLGSKNNLDKKEFRKLLVNHALRVSTPLALRSTASVNKNAETKQKLLDAANKCEIEGTREAALEARIVARTATNATYAADAATYATNATYADAATYAAAAAADADAATYATNATYADAATYAATNATYADAATYAAAAAADADAAAAAAANAAAAAARDKSLSDYAEAVVQILIKLNVPGVQWLYLTENTI